MRRNLGFPRKMLPTSFRPGEKGLFRIFPLVSFGRVIGCSRMEDRRTNTGKSHHHTPWIRISWIQGILLTFLVASKFALAEAPSEFDHPNSFIGNAGWTGGLELWMDVAEIPLGDGSKVPLRLRFTSDGKKSPSLFGGGWWCPLLESEIRTGEDGLRFSSLGGRWRLLPSKAGMFQSKDAQFSARMTDAVAEVDSAAGWKFFYRDGEIAKATSPGGKQLTWEYRDGFTSEIRINGEPLVSLNQARDEIQGPWGRFVLRPEKSGQGRLLKCPDGREERIDIAPDGDDRTKMTISSGSKQVFCWKSSTGELLSDGDFTYEIRRADNGEDILHRIDRKGGTEWYRFDTTRGQSTYKRQDGSRVTSWYHVSPGPLFMKPFRMDTLSKDQLLISSRLLTYDSQGNVQKEWTEPGQVPEDHPEGVRFLSADEAERLHGEAGTLFVDARTAEAFAHGHIPGAVNLSRVRFEKEYPSVQGILDQARVLVVYCTSRQCEDSSIVATRLAQLGFPNVVIFEGGWAEWWKRHR